MADVDDKTGVVEVSQDPAAQASSSNGNEVDVSGDVDVARIERVYRYNNLSFLRARLKSSQEN
jgi:hypothetical protein